MRNLLRRAVASATVLSAAATALSLLNLRHLRRPPACGSTDRISVLVPARDEAARIGPTLDSLRGLVGVAEVLVLDDNSSDGTADLVRAAGLPVIESTDEPPDGWLGKPWACQRLAEAATGDVLVFLDADVQLSPDAATRAAAMLDQVDLVCPYPRQITSGWLQSLVQPLLQWSWLTFLPLAIAERSTHPMLSAGNGQFLVVRRAAYFDAGGHAAVRAEVLEDLALVRRFKAAGHTTAMADGTHIATCRMYSGQRDLVEGYTKSLHAAFGGGTVALLGWMYVLPAAAALSHRSAYQNAGCDRVPDRRGRTGRGRAAHGSGPVGCRRTSAVHRGTGSTVGPFGDRGQAREHHMARAPSAFSDAPILIRAGVTEEHRPPRDRRPVPGSILPVPPLLRVLHESRPRHHRRQ